MARRIPQRLVVVLVAAAIPPLLVTSALRVVANDWIVWFEYEYGRVPPDGYGLSKDERADLARLGLTSITPGSRGIALLEEARLPDGKPAFNTRELEHMQDVRDAVGVAYVVQMVLAAVVAACAAALLLRPPTRLLVPQALRTGAVATLAVALVVAPLMILAWSSFFERFHTVFFAGDTWRFPSTDTLIRLYPDAFWVGVAAWIAGLTVAFALLVLGGSTVWLRRGAEERGA